MTGKNAILLSFLLLAALPRVNGQGMPVAGFSFPSEPYSICLKQPVEIENTSENAFEYLWDFCPETFQEAPSISAATAIPGLSSGWAYKIVKDEGQWTGFILSRDTNKLFRLEFGNDPSNQPTIVDLGNPGGLLVSPQGLDIVNQNGNWFAFVGKGETTTGQVVRLDFGSNIHNTPNGVGLGTFGISGKRMRDLKVVKQGVNYILLIVLDTDNALLRVDYGDSFSNAITSANISSTGTLVGANLPLGFSVVNYLGNWIVHTVSFSNNGIQQYSFGNDILGAASFQGSFTFSSVARPYYIKILREADSFYGFVANENENLSIIKFGDFTSSPIELSNSSIPKFIGFDILKHESRDILQGAVTGTSSFVQVSFENTACPSVQTWSDDVTPLDFSYLVSGSHSIELDSRGNDGQSDVTSGKVTVSSLVAPIITVESDHVCADAPVNFTVRSNNTLAAWDWNLGDNTFSNQSDPMHVYTDPGDYTVMLDVNDLNGCSNRTDFPISIYPQPSPDFTLPSALLCTNNAFIFPTTTPDLYDGNLSYQWFVDGSSVSADRDLQYTFTTTGPKDIKLITAIPGCASEITKTTSSVEAGPVVDFSFAGSCEDDTFSFNNLITDPVTGYRWDFGNGNTSTSPNADLVFADYGDYSVSLTASNAAGCQNVKTKTVSVHARPIAGFGVDGPPNSCSGMPTQFADKSTVPDGGIITKWLWDFADAPPADTKDPVHIFTAAGRYNVSLTATTTDGCSASVTRQVDVYQTPSTAFSFSPACDDLPVLFTPPADNNIVDWYWEIGTSYYTTASAIHTFKSPGDYPLYLQVTASNGCLASVRKVIHVPVPLTPDFSYLKNCVGQEAVLRDITTGADAVVSREWTFDSGENFSGSPVTFVFQKEQTKTVTMRVTAESGCSYQVSRQLQILPSPVAGFTANPPSGAYPLEVEFINTSSQATDYLWKFNDGSGVTSAEKSPVHTFVNAGSYDVQLTASNKQECEAMFSARITTMAPLPDADIEMITLTPNADGSLKLIVTIHNKGNTILKELPLALDFSGILTLRQVLDDAIAPGARLNFVFSTGIANPDDLRYLCVSADLENDLSPDGNRMCKELDDGLYLFPAFPNPTPGPLNVEWIGKGENNIRVTLADAMGKLVLDVAEASSDGLNRRMLDLSGFGSGVYYLVLRQGRTVKTQQIAVSGNP